MIRLIQRRLIIPRGDTGSFTIPILGQAEDGDVAVFSIFDPLTKTTVCEKHFSVTAEVLESKNLNIVLERDDTVNLKAKKYFWDITMYHTPIYNSDSVLIGGAEINSYYAGFSLPICEIKEVAENVPRA